MGGDCTSTHAASTFTANEKKEVLDIHNKYRNGVATGGTKLPEAADMRILVWDDELELVAQRWANQCKFAHDQCRDSERFRVGQNIGIMSATVNPNNPVNYLENIIRAWYDEIEDFDPPDVLLFDGGNSKIGHFTQMVWSSTSLIGCGRVKFTEAGNMQGEMIVCNYGQAGNMIGGYIYAKGPPCSGCPDGSSCCKDYKGLCCSNRGHLNFVHLGIIVQIFVTVTLCSMM